MTCGPRCACATAAVSRDAMQSYGVPCTWRFSEVPEHQDVDEEAQFSAVGSQARVACCNSLAMRSLETCAAHDSAQPDCRAIRH